MINGGRYCPGSDDNNTKFFKTFKTLILIRIEVCFERVTWK